MGRDAVQTSCLREAKASLISAALFEFRAVLEHVIGRLRAGSAGSLGVIEKIGEGFRAVLGAFDAGVKTIFGHRI